MARDGRATLDLGLGAGSAADTAGRSSWAELLGHALMPCERERAHELGLGCAGAGCACCWAACAAVASWATGKFSTARPNE